MTTTTVERLWQQICTVVEAWHGKDVFDLYRDHSPEMKQIRDGLAALAAAPSQPPELPIIEDVEKLRFIKRVLENFAGSTLEDRVSAHQAVRDLFERWHAIGRRAAAPSKAEPRNVDARLESLRVLIRDDTPTWAPSVRNLALKVIDDAAAPSNGAAQERRADPDCVICPACSHEFRAIPENVQAMLAAPPSNGAARCIRCGRYEDGSRTCPNGDLLCPVNGAAQEPYSYGASPEGPGLAETPVAAPPSADEVKRLADDARRYRWLRDVGDKTWQCLRAWYCRGPDSIDKDIDAAIDAICNPGEAPHD